MYGVVEYVGEIAGHGFVAEAVENRGGLCLEAFHRGVCIVDAAVGLGVFDKAVDVVGRQFLLLRELQHGGTQGRRVSFEHVEQRQRDFALAQVVACWLAYVLVLVVIEDVVLDLEAETEQARELAYGGYVGVGSAYGIASHLDACHEQRGGLALDGLHVGRLGEVVEAGAVYLVKLADRQQFAQTRYGVDDAYVAGHHCKLE